MLFSDYLEMDTSTLWFQICHLTYNYIYVRGKLVIKLVPAAKLGTSDTDVVHLTPMCKTTSKEDYTPVIVI